MLRATFNETPKIKTRLKTNNISFDKRISLRLLRHLGNIMPITIIQGETRTNKMLK